MTDPVPNPKRPDAGRRPVRALAFLPAGALILTAAAGCYRRSDMALQPKFWKVYRPTDFFADGQSARQLPEGVVPVESIRTDREYYFAKDAAGEADRPLPRHLPRRLPLPQGSGRPAQAGPRAVQHLLHRLPRTAGLRGRHDRPARFSPPPSFHNDKLLHHEPVGHFYDVITNGYGAMFSYSERIAPDDRWAIAAYVKALQLSQNASEQDVQESRQFAKENQSAKESVKQNGTPAGQGGTQ